MFTIPKHGWVNLQINDLSKRASYLTDIPNDCLDAFIYALQNNAPTVVFFDAEGWDFHLVTSYYQSYIIVDKDDTKLYVIEKNILELARELYEDINNNLNDWLNWDMKEDETKEERRENKERLLTKLSLLNMELIKEPKRYAKL